MSKAMWSEANRVAACALAALLGLASTGDALGAYADCAMCHLDPDPGARAKDYLTYFSMPQRHHRTGTAYPPAQNRDFVRPTALAGDIAFFDRNRNGVADLDEVQLFGADGKIECSSCHREHGDAPAPVQPNMYLRQPTNLLCPVCHRG